MKQSLLKSSEVFTLDNQGAVQSIHVKLSTSIQIKYQLSLSQDLPIVPTNFRTDSVELVSTYHHRGHNRDFNHQHHHHDHHHLSWSSLPPLAVTVVIIIIIICNQPYRHYHNQLSLSWVSSSPSSCHLYNHHYIIIIKVVLGDIHLDNILHVLVEYICMVAYLSHILRSLLSHYLSPLLHYLCYQDTHGYHSCVQSIVRSFISNSTVDEDKITIRLYRKR